MVFFNDPSESGADFRSSHCEIGCAGYTAVIKGCTNSIRPRVQRSPHLPPHQICYAASMVLPGFILNLATYGCLRILFPPHPEVTLYFSPLWLQSSTLNPSGAVTTGVQPLQSKAEVRNPIPGGCSSVEQGRERENGGSRSYSQKLCLISFSPLAVHCAIHSSPVVLLRTVNVVRGGSLRIV